MTDEQTTPDAIYIKGFNKGYIITKHLPEVSDCIVKVQSESPRLDGFRDGPVPARTRPKVAAVWIHPHEMASRDYFWGGWMSVVVEPDQWVLTKPGELKAAPGIVDVTKAGQLKKSHLKMGTPKQKLEK